MNTGLWLEVRVQLRGHHKLNASAKTLGIPRVYLLGHLVSLWLGVLEYAEDGDLWRGTEEKTLRFIESLAELPFDPARFVEVLRLDGWLDGWLIHDWLDYAGKYLHAKYKSHNRQRLVEIWTKHGRTYGRDGEKRNGGGPRLGREWDAVGPSLEPDSALPLTQDPQPTTLNPYTLDEKKGENPKGGVGGSPGPPDGAKEKAGFFNLLSEGSRVKGFVPTQAELTGGGVTHKEVFEAFMPLLNFHAILTLEAFYDRIKHCRTTPANWIMLFLDKIHAVYRDRDGSTLLDDDADPVAMTVAGLVPKKGGTKHHPTDAARQLFVEIMMDYGKGLKGEKSRWAGRVSASAITLELTRRKGKAGKIQ